MRKKTKMAWSVALSAAMAAGLLAGCGSNGGAESTSGSTAASSAKTESSAGDTADTSDRPTYKIATVRWTDTWPTDFLHEGVMKEIEDKMISELAARGTMRYWARDKVTHEIKQADGTSAADGVNPEK